MKPLRLAVIIPTVNGLSLLKKHLPGVIAHSPKSAEVIVVDDGSTDGTAEFLKNDYPKVKCLRQETNLGFTESVNHGFRETTAELVVLLNNDVAVTKDYLTPALKHFANQDIFAVTLNEVNSSWPLVSFAGKLQYLRGEDKSVARYSAWASGGSAVFKKEIWDKLGGFDDVFSPGYWEDIDIGWRAWKAGYKIIWEPKAVVEHQHESTFSKLDPGYVSLIKQRNELIFNWKNISDPILRRNHWLYLARYILTHPGYMKIVLAALKEFPKAKKTAGHLSDSAVLATVNQSII